MPLCNMYLPRTNFYQKSGIAGLPGYAICYTERRAILDRPTSPSSSILPQLCGAEAMHLCADTAELAGALRQFSLAARPEALISIADLRAEAATYERELECRYQLAFQPPRCVPGRS
jgi:hypothetical protein